MSIVSKGSEIVEAERYGEDGLLDGVGIGNARFLNQPSLSPTVEAKELTED
jgi:hypothetical protein